MWKFHFVARIDFQWSVLFVCSRRSLITDNHRMPRDLLRPFLNAEAERHGHGAHSSSRGSLLGFSSVSGILGFKI